MLYVEYHVSSRKSIPCVGCNSLILKRCSCLQFWQFRKTLNILKEWCCPTCWKHRFPFSQIDNKSLTELSFNSNYSCRCQSTITEPSSRFLDKLNLCKLDLKEHTTFTIKTLTLLLISIQISITTLAMISQTNK